MVTGGAGFIGSNLVRRLYDEGHEVKVVDDLNPGKTSNIFGYNSGFVKLDVSKHLHNHSFGDIDVIFHQAAISDTRFLDNEEMMRSNIEGFEKVVNLAREKGAKIVYASSGGVYGNGEYPMKEDQVKDPLNTYSKSKLFIDGMAEELFDEIDIVGLRYFNVFGPNERHKGKPASMIYHLKNQMIKGERPKIFRSGEHSRDHIYVDDVVEANMLAADAPNGIYNVGTGVATSFNGLVNTLNDVLGMNLEPEYVDMPFASETYQSYTQADTSKAESELGFKAKFGLKEGIEDYFEKIGWEVMA